MCVGQVLTQVRTQIQLHQITPNEIENKVLSSCAPYKAQIQPLITASHAIQEAYSGQTTGYLAQFPQAVQDVISNGSALQVLIQNDPSLLNNTAELGPKVKAFTGLIRALSDSDREAVVKELPFLAPVLLSNGSQYATYNSFLNNVDAFTSGESYDKDELLSELNSIHGYFVSVIPQAIDHFYDLIQNATIPEDIVNDNELNAFIKTATSLGQKYGGAFINSGKLAFLLASGISGVFVFTS
uniref:WSN domain-containing protein n=1 Tax=Panagrellus redivivus TaxID=6233 RepID=A0A7E4ZSV1_PANRE